MIEVFICISRKVIIIIMTLSHRKNLGNFKLSENFYLEKRQKFHKNIVK